MPRNFQGMTPRNRKITLDDGWLVVFLGTVGADDFYLRKHTRITSKRVTLYKIDSEGTGTDYWIEDKLSPLHKFLYSQKDKYKWFKDA